METSVIRSRSPIAINGIWDKRPWSDIQENVLTHHMGERPGHFPRTGFKAAYDPEALYMIFRVEDRYVRAVARNNQDTVCTDSTVELFFVPGEDPEKGYFNLETNCGGTFLFRFQTIPRKNAVCVSPEHCASIKIAASMPRIVEPETAEPTTWTLEYRMPLAFLGKYRDVVRPGPGVVWRANVYKCADRTSHPHWLTWSKVDLPKPDFHVPRFFGAFRFE